MKNNIIKFVSRNEIERRKNPLNAFSLVPHLDEMLLKLYRDGEDLAPHQIERVKKYISKLESATNKTNGV
ncbi:MAG: hypothetical protein WCL34_10445 [Methylococcaceae bacterium]|jgi:hypothetical protein